MLVAVDESGQVINLLRIKLSELGSLKDKHLFCPACKSQVYFKKGEIRSPHFAHVSLLSCVYASENESFQHLALKKVLFYWFSKTEHVTIEAFLPELQQIPDLLVNDKLAVEVQCSTLSVKRLCTRTKGYQARNYYVLWLTGKALWLGNRLTALKQQLLNFSEHVGFYYWEVDYQKRELRLNYLIHEDITGKLHYLVQHFAFGSAKLLDILRLPFKKLDSQLSVVLNLDRCDYIRRQLYYKHPKWLKIQELYYQHGQNILTFNKVGNPVFPIGLNYFTCPFEGLKVPEFCQITRDIKPYYQQFISYQDLYPNSILYSPLAYAKFFEGHCQTPIS